MSLAILPSFIIVPPMNFLAAACAGLALRRRRAGRILLGAGLAGLVATSLPIVSGSLTRSLETGLSLTPPPGRPPQAIVILSADEQEFLVGTGTEVQIGEMTLARERAGAALARRTGLPVLVTGGHVRISTPALADMMAASLSSDFGIKAKWQESHSLDTWQNAQFSAAMLTASGINSVYLVTHGWHMRRSEMAFRQAGLAVTASPVALDAKPYLRWGSLVPGAGAWLESYYAIHEHIGCAVYWLRMHMP